MNPTTPVGADPLAQLRGLHLPEAIGPWPPAPGWWMLAAAVVMLLATAVAIVERRRRGLRFRGLRELRALASRWPAEADVQHLATEISILLRRIALARFGRDRVASLHGERWVEFLSQTARTSGVPVWDTDSGHALVVAPYAPPSSASCPGSASRDGLLEKARLWIRENS